jgi:hypothetical protein
MTDISMMQQAIRDHRKHVKDVALTLAIGEINRLTAQLADMRSNEVEPLQRTIEGQRLQIEQLERHIRGDE